VKRAVKIFLKTILWLFISLLVLLILIQTPPVQNFARKKVQAWLQTKLNTRFEIGKVYIGLPSSVIVENIYVEDKAKDTLLYGGRIKANISLFKLIKNEIDIGQLTLEHINANISRTLPDTVYNFQFIIDAFAGESKKDPKTTDTAALKMKLDRLLLNDIRFRYDDTLSGNFWTVKLKHFDTRIETFNPDKLFFDIPSVSVKGLTARMYQYKPLKEPDTTNKTTSPSAMPVINVHRIDLEDIDVDYRNSVSAFYTQTTIGNLEVTPKEFDMAKRRITLDKLILDQANSRILINSQPAEKTLKTAAKETAEKVDEENWHIVANEIRISKTAVRFDNNTNARQKNAMDYSHLNAGNINLQANDFLVGNDSIAVTVLNTTIKEQSGLDIQQLKGKFLYTPTGAEASNLLLQTPGTRIQHTLKIQYASLESLKQHIEQLQVQAILPDSYVKTKDILLFVPSLKKQSLFADPAAVFYITADVSGTVGNLKADVLKIQALKHTRIDLSGTIAGLPSMDNIRGNIRINTLRTSREDMAGFLPASLEKQLEIPAALSLTGNLEGNIKHAKAALRLQTSSGNVSINGTADNYTDSVAAVYNMEVGTQQLQVGKILRNPTLQNISSSFVVQGKGYTVKAADATLKGTIQSVGFKEYTYKNISLNASIKNQKAETTVSLADPNIHFTANATANLGTDSSSFTARVVVDSLKTQPLHLTAKPLIYRGKMNADFTNINPDALNGKLDMVQSLLVTGEKRLQLDTVRIQAIHTSDSNSISLQSDVASASIHGKYKLSEIGTVFQQAIQPYFAIMAAKDTVGTAPYDFSVMLSVADNPAIKVFVPSIERFQSLRFNSHFTSTNGWNATAEMPVLVMNTTNIQNLYMQAGTVRDSLIAKTTVARFNLGGTTLYNLSLTTGIANNNIHFITSFDNKQGKEKYRLSGVLQQPQEGAYTFSLDSNQLLNYQDWTVAGDNSIRISKNDLRVTNFMLNRQFQQFSLKTKGEDRNSPLEAYFTSFQVSTLAAFVTPDSLDVNGTLDGQVLLRDVMTSPLFSGNLTINNLEFKKDTVGNVSIKANNNTAGIIQTDVTITGRGNHVTLNGDYFIKPVNGNDFNFKLSIDTLNMASIEGATLGAITQASGKVTGKFDVTGTTSKPLINGNLHMQNTAFNLAMLNSYYRIDDESVAVNNEGIKFDRFQVKDSANNTATLNGMVYTSDFKSYRFDLGLRANNFRALNTTKKDNKIYYGKLYFSSNMRITGTQQLPVIDGTITIEDKTDLTVVIPQPEPGVAQRKGIVQFVDMDAPENDSLFLQGTASLDSLNTSTLKGLDISANIDLKKEAVFSLVLDQGNGDFIRMQGEGLLNGSIDQSGKITLTGSYELEEGTYELTFNFLRRKFNIQKGSRIVWAGEPTKADVDITAVYIANTASLDLVKNQLPENITATERNKYLQRLPYEVHLIMKGELLQPNITFDVKLPEDKNYVVSNEIVTTVQTRLTQLRQEPSELNKQVFALLLLNRFVTENPFEVSGGLTAESFARQSVSKLLTEQLNQLAADLVHGVDINFNVESEQDYTTGNAQNRTDLNVGLSKRLLNDRLTVTLGSNFELEGPQSQKQDASTIVGNIAVDYRLSKDGRYLLRAYRKNEFEGVIDGYVIETGVGFIITVDYNRFRDIFLGKKGREERRKRRLEQREQEEQQQQKKENNEVPPKVTARKNEETN
jgi:translocation and assembly module TamB